MTHKGCALDGQERALAVGKVRAWRLILASLQDDGDSTERIIDEVEDCPACLRGLIEFLAGSTSSAFTTIAGGSRTAAINRTEELLSEAIEEAEGV
ncbi:hypothetical protein F0Q45_21765 [Mycobacterium simiae]|uniref:Uncharacterized protein n=1 Tax=Mycobacterium simiae TaxID=1784 RepID=A0A5B1BK20_MYCSI|nr:hypothetical protein [Mycobacterium simiae]KAA1248225.1 hypothetical protein F0Q45_21765 [Mycobacterium simiae]